MSAGDELGVGQRGGPDRAVDPARDQALQLEAAVVAPGEAREVAPRVLRAGPNGRRAPKAGTEGGVEPLAVHADEQADAAVGGGADQDRQDAEQQQVGHRVAPALAAARVGDPVQGGEQAGERYHDSFRSEGFDPQQLRHPAGPSAAGPALTNRSWPEPNSPGGSMARRTRSCLRRIYSSASLSLGQGSIMPSLTAS